MRIDELLDDARADAPPMRRDVDDMVAAGRNRLRRRNAGWAIAAVVAVATAIGVPQIVTRPPAVPLAVDLAPSENPGVKPGEKPRFAFEPIFQGYRVDGFTVEDPVAMTLAWTAAGIFRPGVDESVGAVRVYPPGVEPNSMDKAERTGADPVGGREAYYLTRADNGEKRLLWTIVDGSTVEVSAAAGMSRAEVRRVADGFRTGSATPLRTALIAAYLPADYRLIDSSAFMARFVPAERAAQMLDTANREPQTGVVRNLVNISVEPKAAHAEATAEARCVDDVPVCTVLVADGRYQLTVSGQGIDAIRLRKIFDSVTVMDPEDKATWHPVGEAFPTFVRPELD
jgi:hypothetical protein